MTLRKQFIAAFRRRFKKLAADIVKLVDEEDCFGLKPSPTIRSLIGNVKHQFAFDRDEEKIKAFNKWFKQQVDAGILGVDGDVDPDKPWTADYVHSAYRKGVVNAYAATHKKLLSKGLDFYQGSQSQFLKDAFGQPESMSKLRLLATRSYEKLKGITADMSADISRVLTLGMANGKHPREIAAELKKTVEDMDSVRASRLARTEIIHAHAEGQLDSFERLGVEDVGVEAEWSTAGDRRVCPRCNEMAGNTYKVKQAHGLIPLHPNCRCSWIPAITDLPPSLRHLGSSR